MSIPEQAGRSLDDRLRVLAEACRVLDMEGHGNKIFGHMSLRDPDGRGCWIKRAGVSLGEIEGPEDFVLVGYDGEVRSGNQARIAEWPIHTELYRARPEIQAVAHTFPFHACVLGATDADIAAVTREGGYFRGRLARYRVTSNLITTTVLGQGLAAAFGAGYAALLQNHGIVFCGRSIAECVVVGLTLERACKAQFVVNASGLDWTPSRPGDQPRVSSGPISEREVVRFWNHARRKLARAGRLRLHQDAGYNSRYAG